MLTDALFTSPTRCSMHALCLSDISDMHYLRTDFPLGAHGSRRE